MKPSVRPSVWASTSSRTCRTDRERYSVRAVSVAAALESTTATILVLLERLRVQPLSDEVLRERYRLTPREIEVARLLGHGRRNDEIAEALGISSRTAEHHTQRVLMKLGSRSRAQVGDRLRGE